MRAAEFAIGKFQPTIQCPVATERDETNIQFSSGFRRRSGRYRHVLLSPSKVSAESSAVMFALA
jgi:hypothetical protein